MAFKVTVKLPPIAVEFDAGSLAEAHSILSAENTALQALFADFSGDALGGAANETSTAAVTTEAAATAPKTRGRPKKNQPDPSTATAPPPAPVPAAAPPVGTDPVTAPPPADGGIPPFLARNPAPAAPAPAVAPPPPPAASPPIAPPASRLAAPIIADLKNRANGAADKGQSVADWVATTGLVVKGATFDETIAVLQFQTDDKLQPLATALGVQ